MRLKICIILISFLLVFQLFGSEFKLDEDNDGKIDRWLHATRNKKWKLFDINKNNKADESIFFISDKNWIFVINSEKIDYSKNGKPDIWIKNTYKGKNFSKEIKIDSNGDQKVDLIRYEKNDVVYKQNSDNDNDGIFDTFEYFENGVRIKEEIDTNKDGNPDDFYFYTIDNKLIKEELDTNYDKKIDMWVKFKYKANGTFDESIVYKDNNFDGEVDEWHFTNEHRQVIRIERDTNFDGKVDKVENPGK